MSAAMAHSNYMDALGRQGPLSLIMASSAPDDIALRRHGGPQRGPECIPSLVPTKEILARRI